MQIKIFETLSSTQTFLLENPQENLCILARKQTQGIGSRGNIWNEVEKGLYFSFCLKKEKLPDDLALQSASIYFGFLFKETLRQYGYEIWLKWPNDLYIKEKKVGGVMVNSKADFVICGIGLNYRTKNSDFGALGIELDSEQLLEKFFSFLKKSEKWKQIFSKYRLEFSKNFNFTFHYQGKVLDLSSAKLCDDGCIEINGERIYSLR